MDGDSGDFFLSQWPLQEVWRWWKLFPEALSISSCDFTWSCQCTCKWMCSHVVELKTQTWARPQCLPFRGNQIPRWDRYAGRLFQPILVSALMCGHRHVTSVCYKRFEGRVYVHLVSCVLHNKIQKPKDGICIREGDDYLYDGLLKIFIYISF